ncbi:serine protease inhibitor Kazal-type 1-like [Arvicanthis niloticus]|uniref:serine protease inhibitor Kazal-type 1-like n=1 Tax=Arvicanthis niloticus TaxID=61156 RepID=UPI0014862F82|nr:serine protease inhibitor Kazal-type 1-like [Arvicanthis niloticus]
MKVAIIFLLSALALLNLAGNTTAKEGIRKPNCDGVTTHCPRRYEPVCGTDRITYSIECAVCLKNRRRLNKIHIKHTGVCEDEED